MKVLLDTSSLVAAFYGDHPQNVRAAAWLRRARKKELEIVVSTHSLAEVYHVLTAAYRFSPKLALEVIEKNSALFECVSLDGEDYLAIIKRMESLNIQGGAVYDGIIAYAAQKAGVDNLVTLNKKHFDRVYPEFANHIIEP